MPKKNLGERRERWAYEGRIEALILLARDDLLAVGSMPRAVRALGVTEYDVRQAVVRLQKPKPGRRTGPRPATTPGMKWCSDGHESPLSEFGPNRANVSGLQGRCRAHHRKWNRERMRERYRAAKEAAA